MLVLPTKGFTHSVNAHRVKMDILCDWIETSIVLMDDELSQTDIADILVEENVYSTQSFAEEAVGNAWVELTRRAEWIGSSCAYEIDDDWIKRKLSWDGAIAHTFCLLLSMSAYYDWWTSAFGKSYVEQGELFELMTAESLKAQYSDWAVYQTGWTRNNAVGLKRVVEQLVSQLGEEPGNVALWDDPNAKELGLDLLWYRPFPDNRVGIPVYLVQCASGGNWESKLHTPDLNIWCSVISFTTRPGRAFASPFVFLDDQFRKNCTIVQGVLLDRCRILAAFRHDASWLKNTTGDRMTVWAKTRIVELEKRSQ